jgi:cytochrome P450
MTGFTDAEIAQNWKWLAALAAQIGSFLTNSNPQNAVHAATELLAFAARHVQRFGARAGGEAWREARPRRGMVLHAMQQDERIQDSELAPMVAMFLVPGTETTTKLIGNAMTMLLHCPGELRKVRDDTALAENCILETLRFATPTKFISRETTERGCSLTRVAGDTALDVPPHTLVMIALHRANRDPAEFGVDADEFRVTRAARSPVVSFGFGSHMCVGRHLATAEATLAVQALLRRYPHLEAVEKDPERWQWLPDRGLRGRSSLPVYIT